MPPREKTTPDQAGESTGSGENSDTVTLAVRHPYDALDVGDGLVITADGTEVPADQEQTIRDTAKAAGVRIRKVS